MHGRVVLYADHETASMKWAINETNRRRDIQRKYNEEHGITPQTVEKQIAEALVVTREITDKGSARRSCERDCDCGEADEAVGNGT